MKMTFLDLRRDPGKLLDAINKREEVALSRRGRTIARIVPAQQQPATKPVAEHPAFGMWADNRAMKDPAKWVRDLRKGRHRDL